MSILNRLVLPTFLGDFDHCSQFKVMAFRNKSITISSNFLWLTLQHVYDFIRNISFIAKSSKVICSIDRHAHLYTDTTYIIICYVRKYQTKYQVLNSLRYHSVAMNHLKQQAAWFWMIRWMQNKEWPSWTMYNKDTNWIMSSLTF